MYKHGDCVHAQILCISLVYEISSQRKLLTCHWEDINEFYFTKWQQIAPCALFLAAKVEEQPRKLEHVIKVAHRCLSRESTTLDPQSDVSRDQIVSKLFLKRNVYPVI